MITQTQLINNQLIVNNPISNSEIIKDQINVDLASAFKKNMQEGVRYYEGEHDILDYDFREYIVDGETLIDDNKANNQVPTEFHKLLVDQKCGYIVGNPLVIGSEEKGLTNRLSSVLGEQFNDIVVEWVKGASNKAREWLHPFINEEGEFDYIIIPSEQVIPIYDTSYQKKLLNIIRYYKMQVIEEDKTVDRYRVEFWDKEKVTFYMEDDKGNYDLDDNEPINPKYHWYSFNTNTPDDKKAKSWGKIPFINLDNNSERTTDLRPIKRHIDAYDKVSSGFLNDIEDIQMALWVLKGYEGTNLSEFMKNLLLYKAIKVSEDGTVESKTLEIPVEARKIMLDILEDKIYEVGQGVKMSTDKFGQNPSGVSLEFLYSGLDIKANTMIRKLKRALQEFIWFATEYINIIDKTSFDYKKVTYTINKTIITNKKEQIENCKNSVGIISNRTIRANHPWVDDVNKEEKQIRKEEEQNDLNPYKKVGEDDEE